MNPEDTTSAGSPPRLEDREVESRLPPIEYEPDAVAFMDSQGLGEERARVEEILQVVFSAADSITVSLEYDPEEQDAEPSVVLHIATDLSVLGFREARRRAYRQIDEAGCRRYFVYLAMVRARRGSGAVPCRLRGLTLWQAGPDALASCASCVVW